MSQNDFTLANQSFPAFRADLNSALQALATNSSGASAPSTTFANMWWYDTSNNIMYIRNEDNDAWIKFAELDQANDKFVLSGTLQLDDGTVSAPALTFNSDTNMGIYRGGTDILKFVTAGTDAVTINASQDVTLAGSLNFADNEKAIFGAGSDLQIYHDGGNSIISEAGTGDIIIYTNGTAFQVDSNTGENMIYAAPNAHVQLFYNNEQKFTTTANGFDLGDATASVYTDLNILGASTANYGAYLGFVSGGTSFGKIARYGRIQGGTSNDFFITTGTTNNLLFGINNVEKARLDTSGNLLVGTTTAPSSLITATSGSGHALTPNYVAFTRQSADASFPVVVINETGVDGILTEFRKDGTSVGSIGSRSGGNIYIDSAGESGRLQASGSDVLGWYTGQFFPASDTGASLGTSANRFSNLYLSGGVYLGGTGSANLLDSYEEGTWTPSLAGSSTAGSYTYSDQSGYYIKVGNKVTLTFNVELSAVNSAGSGFLRIKGSPFSTSGGAAAQFATGSIILRLVSFNGAANTLVVKPRSSSSTEFVISEVFDGSGTTEVSATDLGNSSEVNGQITLLLTS